MRLFTRLVAAAAVLAATAVIAPAALASSTATMSLNQSAGTTAAGTHNLGLNLTFTNSGTDSPGTLNLNLPPGLLANAAIDNGQCIKQNLFGNAACQIGTGTVSAAPVLLPALPLGITAPASIPISVTYYLVPPPKAGDLAGLAVEGLGQQIGATGDITIRPSGSSGGVGASISLTLPHTLPTSGLPAPFNNPVVAALVGNLVNISITAIDNTFQNLRYPATCSGLSLTGSATGFQSGDAPSSFSQPLAVSNCTGLAYNPQFAVSAVRDKNDKAVTLTTNVTQAATESPNSAVSLTFPTTFLGPNINSLGTFCANSTGSGCTPVGSVAAASPLYPLSLTGNAYLTGNSAGLTLTLVFPAPFPLTLVGKINLLTNTAAFSGLPDIPLTSLKVTLNGGAKGLFETNCVAPSGTATAGLTDQAGDKTRSVPAKFTVSGCPPGSTTGTGTGTGTGPGSGTGSGDGGSTGGSPGSTATAGSTHLAAKSISGLAEGKPSLRFTVSAKKHAPKLKRITVKLPAGLSFARHTVHKKAKVLGVKLKGAKAGSLKLSHGHLAITLRKAAHKVTVTLGTRSLKESPALRAKAQQRKLKSLKLRVTVRNTKRVSHTLTIAVRKLHL